jgi:gamma-glutamylputrescine oxidase
MHELMAEASAIQHMQFLEREETAEKLGSTRYHGGTYDAGTGPHQSAANTWSDWRVAAAKPGARLHENTKARARSAGGKVTVKTETATITAGQALIACNAYIEGLEPVTSAHVMPIRSFIGATVPLSASDSPVIPGGESVDDSRFVVRYFRKSGDDRLLFGGREAYTSDNPRDISST